ncbi:MAG: uroporphyrinogen decarboxylase/cobalamine-independent methonine synthase family protein [Anaerolineae bacterium]
MQPLLYKPDLDDAAKRLDAWWDNELLDRACVQVTAPRADALPEPYPPARDLEQRWTDIDLHLQRLEIAMRRTYFGGEAIPMFMANVGPDAFAAFFGAQVEFLPDTTWVRPLIRDWNTAPDLVFDPANSYWQLQYSLLKRGSELGQGKWLAGFPDSHTGPDALSALRGRESLCYDFYDHPDKIRTAMKVIRSVGKQVFEAYFDLLKPEVQGSSSGWCTAWGKGRCNVNQCDFMALISPQAFQTYFDEWLQEELSWFDRVVWHLDGPECLPHLDYLLSQPKIKAIQWVPGAGMPPMSQWIPLLKRIQAAGKGLWCGCESWEVEILTRELSSRGLMMITGAASQAEADQLVADVAKWSHA